MASQCSFNCPVLVGIVMKFCGYNRAVYLWFLLRVEAINEMYGSLYNLSSHFKCLFPFWFASELTGSFELNCQPDISKLRDIYTKVAFILLPFVI